VHPTGDGWRVAVAGGDQPGLLARVAAALGDAGLSVERATVASFGDRGVLDVFWVTGSTAPDPDALAGGILDAFRAPRRLDRVDGVEVTLDNEASPWFTVCTVVGPDRPGLLADLAAAISADGVVVHGARLASSEGTVVDRFDLSDRKGRKLDAAAVAKVAGRLGAASSAGTA
jgi:[protein-PII] uridylyltransferase